MTSLLRRREAREGGYSLELPISKQFTPQQIPSLRELLQLVHDHGPASGGDLDAARRAVKKRFFAAQRRGGSEAKRITMAGNAIGSARHWGLLDDDLELTATGRAALAAPDEDGAVRILVEHFLRGLGGAQTVKAILDIVRANDGIAPEKTELAKSLRKTGIYENGDGTDHGAVLGWLSHPGAQVVTAPDGRGRWVLDERRFAKLAGTTTAAVDALAARDPVQIAILTEVARAPGGRSDASTMQRLLEARADLDVSAPGFRRRHLDPLQADGLIEIASGRGSRGATAFSITKLGRSEALTELVERYDADGTLRLRPADLLRPTHEIVADLDPANQPDRNRRGVALEHLALRILDWLGLGEVEWRVRPDRAEEIDGTAQGAMPAFARWQVQAKNTARLTADDAAKEVGLAVVNGASVVMLITTVSLTAPARSIVERAERRGGLSMLCVEGSDVRRIAADPGCLTEIVARESLRTRSLRAA